MRFYVVRGQTGEYSDHDEWTVCAYTDEAMAQHHVEQATAAAKVLMQAEDRYMYSDQLATPWDPFIRLDYTGTHYTYEAVDTREEAVPFSEEEARAMLEEGV
ncbi:MAG: hypothetical protein VW239_00260 [Candidatus Nanopelagicales bacterium]